ncbi:Lysophospholipid acyltransferase [Choanephora cucurbitarum]|uniref:Lysophospholipid acyltransferase n=1 Tax=Choanephora cucurbitarum TaxID=101091 RepID=A0A1C7NH49_9FUNG|nr:Lysophospholipid acyltransferase [Choanephora cucurbitarum]
MDQLFIRLSESLGGRVAPDHLKLAFSILSTYPSAFVFKRLGSSTLKHLFSIVYTSWIMLFVLQLTTGFIHIMSAATITYVLGRYCHTKQLAWINFAMAMLSMSICHLQRQWKGIEGDTELDCSGALMILTIKLSSFGFNVLDGKTTNQEQASAHMKITQYPSLVQFYGWILFFAGFLAGPTCEYMDYIRFVESDEAPRDSLKPALQRLGKSMLFMLSLATLAPQYNYFNALQPAFANFSFPKKLFFIQLSAILTRCKYYCVWYLAEGACILSGFGFSGYDEQNKACWDRLKNVNFLSCELAQSYKQLSANWNMGANRWLRNYVYLRLESGSNKTTLITYVISAMWHGFQPGFYFFFMTISVLQIFARQVRKTVRPLFLTIDGQPIPYWKSAYDVVTWIASMSILNMLVPCFDLLLISRILHIWRSIYFCHFAVILSAFVAFPLIQPHLVAIQKKRLVTNKQK